ncbi:unnamed protein product [Blepharisma stoltei]|uniref:Uncharacterized protein n=1 Tax=Blepharisma stoltei TaxID=1481888 RepID=A0AAU9IKG5_9CILI|nr:unnamed protein product [Blepharisma stoltei]
MSQDLKDFLDRTKNLRSSFAKRANLIASSATAPISDNNFDELDVQITKQIEKANCLTLNYDSSILGYKPHTKSASSRSNLKPSQVENFRLQRLAFSRNPKATSTDIFEFLTPRTAQSPIHLKLPTLKNPYLSQTTPIIRLKKPKKIHLIVNKASPSLKISRLEKAYS